MIDFILQLILYYIAYYFKLLIFIILPIALFIIFIIVKSVKAHKHKVVTGLEGMIGLTGNAKSDINPRGKVYLHGEFWNAKSNESIKENDSVEVIGIDGIDLIVKKKVET